MIIAESLLKRRHPFPTLANVFLICGLVLVASGCSSPVGIKPVDIQTAYSLNTESALSVEQPSEASKKVLRRLGLMDRFETEPAAVLAELHAGLKSTGHENRLFALAELSLLHAERTGDRAYFLASAVYAWALLFPGDGSDMQLQPSDPRFRLTYDLYNQGIADGLAAPDDDNEDEDDVQLKPGDYKLPFGTLHLTLDESGMSWGGYRLDRFISTTSLEVSEIGRAHV